MAEFRGAGGDAIRTSLHVPMGACRAVVLWIHGHGDHLGSFAPMASPLVDAGVAFASLDLQGHGSSGGARGVVREYSDLWVDVAFWADLLRKRFPKIPLILGGHSMGGGLALGGALLHQVRCDAVVAWSPWLVLGRSLGPVWLAIQGLARWLPPTITIGSGVSPQQLSARPERWKAVAEDPLRHVRISFRLLEGAWKCGRDCLAKPGPAAMPGAIWHGTGDTVTLASASQKLAKRQDFDYYALPGLLHEIHWECGHARLVNELLAWMQRRSIAQQEQRQTSQYGD